METIYGNSILLKKSKPYTLFQNNQSIELSGEWGEGRDCKNDNYCIAFISFPLTQIKSYSIKKIILKVHSSDISPSDPYNVLEIMGMREAYTKQYTGNETYFEAEKKGFLDAESVESIKGCLIDPVKSGENYYFDVSLFIKRQMKLNRKKAVFKLQRERQHIYLAYNTNGSFFIDGCGTENAPQLCFYSDEEHVPLTSTRQKYLSIQNDDTLFRKISNSKIHEFETCNEMLKKGDMAAAKHILLQYYKKKLGKQKNIFDSFNYEIDDNEIQAAKQKLYYYNCKIVAACNVKLNKWQKYSVTIPYICNGCILILDTEKSGYAVELCGNYDIHMCPELLILDSNKNVRKTIKAEICTYIQAGHNKRDCMGNAKIMLIQEEGQPLSDQTKRAFIRFPLEKIVKQPEEEYQLSFYARTNEKEIKIEHEIVFVTGRLNSDIDLQTFCWNNHVPQIFSYKSNEKDIDDAYNWTIPAQAEPEFANYITRLGILRTLSKVYCRTRDEEYAQLGINILLRFFIGRSALYPRWLDISWRVENVLLAIHSFVDSKYMTPETFYYLLNAVMTQVEFLGTIPLVYNNQGSAKLIAEILTVLCFDEIDFTPEKQYQNFYDQIIAECSMLYSRIVNEDGSYNEGVSTGYSVGVLKEMKKIASVMLSNKIKLPDAYYKSYRGLVEYILQCAAPGGIAIAYGDCAGGRLDKQLFMECANQLRDPFLLYITSSGINGQRPDYHMKHYRIGKLVMSRQNWIDADSLYIAMNASNHLQHSHRDDLHLDVYGFGRFLLCDSGIPAYGGGNPEDYIPRKTRSHNTVTINNLDQEFNSPSDITCDEEENMDVITAYTMATKGFKHTRRVLFLRKEGYLIVSDYLEPEDEEIENTYWQTWNPDLNSKVSIDSYYKIARTHYGTGGNIQVIPMEINNINAFIRKDGFINCIPNKDGYIVYEQKKIKGKTQFHTILLPHSISEETRHCSLTSYETNKNLKVFHINIQNQGTATYTVSNEPNMFCYRSENCEFNTW